MEWAELVPVFFFALMFIVPKSPRFLVKIDKNEFAENVLEKIGEVTYAKQELSNIELTLKECGASKVKLSDLRSTKIKPILIIGMVLLNFPNISHIYMMI
ncbi:MFS transporter [Gaetbulibacter saemankumensis]|uniref:MFS transporter n=1 Tax=Gaetbulibacter saemankumensis TaxID=311208 RepID=UPI000482C53D|nr:MFS transporter [Gaetbulibacter saemankumensis]